jgi:hypothetical protein
MQRPMRVRSEAQTSAVNSAAPFFCKLLHVVIPYRNDIQGRGKYSDSKAQELPRKVPERE